MTLGNPFVIILIALALDAVFGDPRWLYNRIPHPARIMGWGVAGLDRFLNRENWPGGVRRFMGALAVFILLAVCAAIGLGLMRLLAGGGWQAIVLALIASTLIAQNSLYRHGAAVRRALEGEGLAAGRAAVAQIVGRETAALDEAGVSRAAIESIAENFSDGVVAPVFWAALGGLPGLMAYKALNTADSMIGHQNSRYRDFGWAAARLDDLANFIPARLAALVLAVAAGLAGGRLAGALSACLRDGTKHRSWNAGYPEAAMAGALDLRLAGPRRYGGERKDDPWLGDGRAAAGPADIAAALRIYVIACGGIALLILGLAALDLFRLSSNQA